MPDEIKVLSCGAVEAMVKALGAEFERATGNKLDLNFGTAGSLRARFEGGEVPDLIVLPAVMTEALEKAGRYVPGSRVDLGRTVTGVVVKEGAPAPDISTPDAFKQALLKAKTVSYTDPKAGGSSGTYMSALLQKLGIADAIGKKAVLGKRGYEVAEAVADGRAEIGTTFISEALTVQRREGGRSAAGRPLSYQYLLPPPFPPAAAIARAPRHCCKRLRIPPRARAGPKPALSRRSHSSFRSSPRKRGRE